MSFTDEEIAQVAHAAAVELANVLGVASLPPWSSLDPNARGNATYVAKVARYGATPEAVHSTRMQVDPELAPYDNLPPEDQALDYLLAGVCAAANKAGEGIQRVANAKLSLEEAAALVARQAEQNQALGTGAAMPFGSDIPPQPPVTVQEG